MGILDPLGQRDRFLYNFPPNIMGLTGVEACYDRSTWYPFFLLAPRLRSSALILTFEGKRQCNRNDNPMV